MEKWKTSRSTERPDEIDASSSKTTVYVRKNVREVEAGEGERKVKMYEYEEKRMTKEEFVAYVDLLETARKALRNESDITLIQDALCEIDSMVTGTGGGNR